MFYHVIVRGNQQQRTFHDDQDRITYLERLELYRQRYGFRLFAYVLMSNHVHLLLKPKSVPLSWIMQGIQFSTTKDTTDAIARSAICFKAATKRHCAMEMRICLN